MSDRISAAAMVHLENELGPELAQVIFDPVNVPKVRELAQELVRVAMLTTNHLRAVVSAAWKKLFGHMKVWNNNFNEVNFPLEPKEELREVIQHQFEDTDTGHKRLEWAESQGLELAGIRATGLYLQAHPELQMNNPVIGGGQWRDGRGIVCVPVFFRDGGEPDVGLGRLGNEFSPDCVWLFSRKLAGN